MKKLNKSLMSILIIAVLLLTILAPIVKAESSPFQKFTGMYLKTTEVEPNGKVYVEFYMGMDSPTEAKVFYAGNGDYLSSKLMDINTNSPYFYANNVKNGEYNIAAVEITDSEGTITYFANSGQNAFNTLGRGTFTVKSQQTNEKIALNNIQIKGTDVVTPDVTKLDLDLSFTGDVSEISLMFKNYETNSSFAAYVQDIKGNPYIKCDTASLGSCTEGRYVLTHVALFLNNNTTTNEAIIYTNIGTTGQRPLNNVVAFNYSKGNNTTEENPEVYLGWVSLDSRTAKVNDKVWFNIAHDNHPSKIMASFIDKENNKNFNVYLRWNNSIPYFIVPITAEPGEYELNYLVMTVNGKNYHFKADEITPDPATNNEKKCQLTIEASETEEITTENNVLYLDNEKIDDKLLSKIKELDDNISIIINADNNPIIDSKVFDAVKGQNKNLTIEFGGFIEWNFNGLDIKNSKTIDVSLKVEKGQLVDFIHGEMAIMKFAANGELPGKCLIRLDSTCVEDDLLGDAPNVYYYQEGSEMFDKVAMELTKSTDGYYEFYINHNSTYVMTSETIPEEYVSTDSADLDLNSELSTTSENKEDKKDNTFFTKQNIISIAVIGVCVILLILLLSGKVLGPRKEK